MTNNRTDDRELSRHEFSVEALTALFAGVVKSAASTVIGAPSSSAEE